MQQRDVVSGFTELKDLLIRTYQINRSRDLVKLYFSQGENELLMHDYDDHNKVISLCANLSLRERSIPLTQNAHRVIGESLKHKFPAEFLNSEFLLNGFFRP